MATKQEKALFEKLTRIGYPIFAVQIGEEETPMLHIEEHLISSVDYALSLDDDALKALIDETVQVAGDE